jgi:K+-sensing histidine kinase KdpD
MLLNSVQKWWKITISITEKKEVIEVSIHNNGKGIKEEEFRYFDKFYQSRNQNVKNLSEAV